MKSDDPNLPKEIPPIPDPQEGVGEASTEEGHLSDKKNRAEPWESAEWTDATDSGNPDEGGAQDAAGGISQDDGIAFADRSFNGADVDYDYELDGPETVPPTPDIVSPLTREPGADDARQREAEKPSAANENYDDWGQSEVPYQPKELGIIDQLLLLLADGTTVWRKVLRWVRSQLPPTWQQRLSDEIMTAISLGLLVLVLALWNPLGGGKTSQPVAEKPASPPVETAGDEFSDVSPAEDETPELAPAPGISTLPDTTPEQSLIAEIQDKVSNISRAFAAGLIQSVEVNFPENRLVVNVGENWYGLLDEQQNEVSQSILDQVQQLDFKTLQLRDPDGVVVARNPVVGSNMVILHRSRSSEAELLIS